MNQQPEAYELKTYGSSDPVRAFSHKARIATALSLCRGISHSKVLDFGGGDGRFLRLLSQQAGETFEGVLFEPFMQAECGPRIKVEKHWESVKAIAANGPFDLVSCQEVLEHFSPHRQEEALDRMASVLAPDGWLMISVPVEVGPVAVVKNLGRWKYRSNSPEIYNYGNLLRSLLRMPVPEARAGAGYLTHMGFDFQDLERLLKPRFVLERILGSPFRTLPYILNAQIFYLCRPKGPNLVP